MGLCGCTMGPPIGGRCYACGAIGQPLPYQCGMPVAPVIFYPNIGVDEETLKKVMREVIREMKDDLLPKG